MAEFGETSIFDFMMVRAPNALAAGRRRRRYVADRRLERQGDVGKAAGAAELRSLTGRSEVAKIVVDAVGSWNGENQPAALAALQAKLRAFMIARRQLGTFTDDVAGPPEITVEELEDGAYLADGARLYLVRDRLNRLPQQDVVDPLHEVQRVLWEVRDDDCLPGLVEGLTAALGVTPERYVLGGDSLQERWGRAQQLLFDALYVGYVCTRFVSINLDALMEALRALHAVQAIALDSLVRRLAARAPDGGAVAVDADPLPPGDQAILKRAEAMWPELVGWDRTSMPPGFPLVASHTDLAELLRVPVMVHPVFARLFFYLRPFNRLKPIGLGDLKIVRQKLVAYRPGEISHIHNVMQGETRGRRHRRLERTEEQFQTTGSRTEDGTTESQTTDRFELKSEADNVIKTMLNVNANANVTTSGKIFTQQVTVSAGGGFAYNRSSENHSKSAQNFARDVVNKAVERVETKTTTTRSTTKLFETEEHNTQRFANPDGDHVSGIYRWVDKEYQAQVYNYGRRTMYEFVVPEPAAMWVTGRLRGFESELDVPQPPGKPPVKEVDLGFGPADITVDRYKQLAKSYNLSQFPPRPETRTVALVPSGAGDGYVFANSPTRQNEWHAVSKTCEAKDVIGYDLVEVWVEGHIDFNGQNQENRFTVSVNGVSCKVLDHEHEFWYLPDKFGGSMPAPEGGPLPLTSETITFAYGFRRVGNYGLIASARLRLGAGRSVWQQQVYEHILGIEQDRIDQINKEARQAYEAEVATYRNRLSELAALQLADLVRGTSEAANRAVMDGEIKRACISAITREFDSDQSDDLLPLTPAMDEVKATFDVTRFQVHDALTTDDDKDLTTARFVTSAATHDIPVANLANARTNAFLVQFIEQAFEWERVSYLFYPYYWAQRQHWLSLMNREDGLDATFSAFLRAGMARVLLSVTPGYECAVQHYLETRRPWLGACDPPVIDDELFVPLFEEVQEQSVDDREGGVPEGKPWIFTVPTTLVYLHASSTPLPDLEAEREQADDETVALRANGRAALEAAGDGHRGTGGAPMTVTGAAS